MNMMQSFVFVAVALSFIPIANGAKAGDILCSNANQEQCASEIPRLSGCVYQASKCVFDPTLTCPPSALAIINGTIKNLEKMCANKLATPDLLCAADCLAAALQFEIVKLQVGGLTEAKAVEMLTQFVNSTIVQQQTKHYLACVNDLLGDVSFETIASNLNKIQSYNNFTCGPYSAEQVKNAYKESEKALNNFGIRLTISITTIAMTIFSMVLFA